MNIWVIINLHTNKDLKHNINILAIFQQISFFSAWERIGQLHQRPSSHRISSIHSFQRTCFSMIKGYGRCISLLGPSPLAYWLPPTGSNSALSNRRSFPSTPFLSVSLPRSFYTSRIKRKCQLINGSAKRATLTIKFHSKAWFIVRLFCNTA